MRSLSAVSPARAEIDSTSTCAAGLAFNTVHGSEVARRGFAAGLAGIWLLLCISLGSCSSSDAQARYRRDSGVFAAVVQSLIGDVPAGAPASLVYLSPVDESASVPLEVQAAVIKKLAPRIDAKFVDARDQAVDDSLQGSPVLDDGILLVVPKLPAVGETFDLQVERYRASADRMLLHVEVRDSDPTSTGWTVRVLSEQPLPDSK